MTLSAAMERTHLIFGRPPWHLPERFLSPDWRGCGATPTRLAACVRVIPDRLPDRRLDRLALRFVAIIVAIVLAATAALIRALRLFSSESEMMRVRRKAVNALMML